MIYDSCRILKAKWLIGWMITLRASLQSDANNSLLFNWSLHSTGSQLNWFPIEMILPLEYSTGSQIQDNLTERTVVFWTTFLIWQWRWWWWRVFWGRMSWRPWPWEEVGRGVKGWWEVFLLISMRPRIAILNILNNMRLKIFPASKPQISVQLICLSSFRLCLFWL